MRPSAYRWTYYKFQCYNIQETTLRQLTIWLVSLEPKSLSRQPMLKYQCNSATYMNKENLSITTNTCSKMIHILQTTTVLRGSTLVEFQTTYWLRDRLYSLKFVTKIMTSSKRRFPKYDITCYACQPANFSMISETPTAKTYGCW